MPNLSFFHLKDQQNVSLVSQTMGRRLARSVMRLLLVCGVYRLGLLSVCLSLRAMPRPLDFMSRHLDFMPCPCDFTPRPLDFTPRPLDFMPCPLL